ncbi:hypothetical protein [Haloarcula marismortui]|uniref:Uncharacterized protein n=1 Tax=Haloarcula marismortui ATCC 33799 TaxID=662475 RepID=M0JLM1_9EURY|nr:hypothetical protein [Haloarcula californiae]EMA09911.1 hypothetical protein C435_21105 [Haloarcula californiae ATCC 33799]
MTLAAVATDWEHDRRGVPADEVEGVPDDATTWACLGRTNENDVPTAITIYNANGDGGYVTVAVDNDLEGVEEYNNIGAAAVGAMDLMDEYGASE